MATRAGVAGTEVDGIFFTEAPAPPGTRVLAPIAVRKKRQNWDLARIKISMATEAARLGANAVVSFRYGQRSHKWYELMLPRWDTEGWYGEGEAAVLPSDTTG
jgi:hypothetical protein